MRSLGGQYNYHRRIADRPRDSNHKSCSAKTRIVPGPFVWNVRAGTEIVGSIELDPCLDLLKMIEHLRAVDLEIANILGNFDIGSSVDGIRS